MLDYLDRCCNAMTLYFLPSFFPTSIPATNGSAIILESDVVSCPGADDHNHGMTCMCLLVLSQHRSNCFKTLPFQPTNLSSCNGGKHHPLHCQGEFFHLHVRCRSDEGIDLNRSVRMHNGWVHSFSIRDPPQHRPSSGVALCRWPKLMTRFESIDGDSARGA